MNNTSLESMGLIFSLGILCFVIGLLLLLFGGGGLSTSSQRMRNRDLSRLQAIGLISVGAGAICMGVSFLRIWVGWFFIVLGGFSIFYGIFLPGQIKSAKVKGGEKYSAPAPGTYRSSSPWDSPDRVVETPSPSLATDQNVEQAVQQPAPVVPAEVLSSESGTLAMSGQEVFQPAPQNVIYCSRCGFANARGRIQCEKCGTQLPSLSQFEEAGLISRPEEASLPARPGCVTAYAILLGIGALILAFGGFSVFAGQEYMAAGFVSFIAAIILILIAVGLWRQKKWARILVIILSVLNVLTSLISLLAACGNASSSSSGAAILGGLISLAVAVIILSWFSSNGKYFR